MTSLKEAIADKNDTLTSGNYINASGDKQQAYTNQVDNAEAIINGTQGAVLIPSEISNATSQVNAAKQDLNGDENLEAAKQDAKQYLDTLGQITDQQKANLLNQIKQSPHISDVNQVKQAANDLNQAMQQLQAEVNQAPQVK
ncbi:hypothetical protein CRN61_24770, partial [Vibrio vulnificus]